LIYFIGAYTDFKKSYDALDKLQSSFNNLDAGTGVKDVGAPLAWSPDAKYLAESAISINIYDVNAKKIVTTFGKVAANHKIFGLAWAPDGNGLVSSADLTPDDGHSQTLVNVWGLS
jgi:WD40 repeat protein